MALVLDFQLREKAPAQKRETPAEVIIFPGVRFERLPSGPEDLKPDSPDKTLRAQA